MWAACEGGDGPVRALSERLGTHDVPNPALDVAAPGKEIAFGS